MKASVLVVDDDPDIRMVVRVTLEKAGMQVEEAASGRLALDRLNHRGVDLVVLDVGMPGMDGFECCRAIRAMSRLPVLFLTAQDDEIDRVLGFELGADDYVAKPFSPRELVLRIKAILARGRPDDGRIQRHGDLVVDTGRHISTLGGRALDLTATQFAVLKMLLDQRDLVIDRNRLIDEAFGGNSQLSGRTVDSHVRNIRAKAAALGYPDVVQTVRGVGLRLGSCITGPGPGPA
jgi:two-component system OmpR family response regulator